jgi:hypothetical protein
MELSDSLGAATGTQRMSTDMLDGVELSGAMPCGSVETAILRALF